MNDNKSICLVFRGELLRNRFSCFNKNKTKKLKEPDLSEESIIRQDNIMKSIINNIILPYEKNGFNVFISGCVYECNSYDNKLKEFFPNNTIKQIKPGKTNQAEMFYNSIVQGEKEHPYCIEYISLRLDYIMLRNINIKELDLDTSYVGFAWENNIKILDVDVFFIISKNSLNIFKKILHHMGSGKGHIATHDILFKLKQNNIILYSIWDNYSNHPTGILYSNYIENKELHKNRPLVNYMRKV